MQWVTRESAIRMPGIGSSHTKAKEVHICVGIEQGCNVLIAVKDDGSGFDRGQIQNPVIGDNVFPAHGQGYF